MVADVAGGGAEDQSLLVSRQRRGGQVWHPPRFPRWGRKSRGTLRLEAAGLWEPRHPRRPARVCDVNRPQRVAQRERPNTDWPKDRAGLIRRFPAEQLAD